MFRNPIGHSIAPIRERARARGCIGCALGKFSRPYRVDILKFRTRQAHEDTRYTYASTRVPRRLLAPQNPARSRASNGVHD